MTSTALACTVKNYLRVVENLTADLRFIYFQSVSGTGNTRAAFILEIIALALYTIYILIVITGLKADVAICWTAEHLYAICIGIASYLYIRKANWQHKRI